MEQNDYVSEATTLLKKLVSVPSISRSEKEAADCLQTFMESRGLHPQRQKNNLWLIDPDFSSEKETILLNAHIDTVKPVSSWTKDPFTAVQEGDRLYGLGTNDCGGGLVSLLQTWRILTTRPHHYNLIYLASAEEEVSGTNGIASVLPLLPPVSFGIVGEPTAMQPAIAERGLMVVDGIAHGKSGHAARNEGVNAIYEALDDLIWLRDYRFPRISDLLGATRMSVTVVNSGTQHNVVPDECRFIIDVRTNELYTNEEVFHFIDTHTKSELKARSFRLGSSSISITHPFVQRCLALGMKPFGSPTLSDQALMRFPSLKLGPGHSSRSHSADEYILISEISHAIDTYLILLSAQP